MYNRTSSVLYDNDETLVTFPTAPSVDGYGNTDGSNSSTDPLMGISKSCLVSVALFIVVFACFSICLYYSISGDGMSIPLGHI